MDHAALRVRSTGLPLGLALGLAAGACGDNLRDPLAGSTPVSSTTPFSPSCLGIQGGINFAGVEVEPSLAIDPADPAHLVAAWQQDRWSSGGASGIGAATSFDGGRTWTAHLAHFGRCAGGDATNGGDYDRATDPWLSVGADGTVYQSALAFDARSPRNAMLVSQSSDGGVTWSEPVVLRGDDDPDVFNDKDSITADPVQPGRVYAVWDRLTGQTQPMQPVGTGPAWLARATDGVWEPARPIFDPGVDAQTIGNIIAVLPDGTVVDVFDQINQASSASPTKTVASVRSADSGLNWSAATMIAPMHGAGVEDPSNHVFIRAGEDLPTVAVDRASGALYVAWEDAAVGAKTDRISLVVSHDGGLSWSEPVQVNGSDAAAFTPVPAVTADGTVGVMYYDLRGASSDSFQATAWLATSSDGGATWHDQALSDPFDLRPALLADAYFLGDYQGLASTGNELIPLFVATTPDPASRTDVFVRPP